MNRYASYGRLDDVPEVVGDAGFTRLDMLTDPALLEQGELAASENLRFDANGTTVRAGIARQFPAGSGVGRIYGVCGFKPNADEDYLALATDTLLVIFNLATQQFTYANYPSSQTINQDDAVDLVQAGVGAGTLPEIYVLRGPDKTVLKFDANTGATTAASGFAPGSFALFYQDRIAVADRQNVKISDFLNFTQFSLLNQFQILKGGDDYLQCFMPYQRDYVLIGTRQGWFIAFFDSNVGAGGYTGALSDSSFLRLLTREAGPVGPRAAIEAMGLIWFITGGAIYAFQPQLDNQLTVLGQPISAEIQPIMDRMCVRYASRACVERYGYRLYFALPISDVPVAVTSVAITPKFTAGLLLPFTLPTTLSTSALVKFTTAADHGLVDGDRVQITNSVDAGLNGEFAVTTVASSTEFNIATNIADTAIIGSRVKMQRLATRNNVIAVYNLNNKGWESIDWLPSAIRADWLRPVEHAAQRRLMLIDQDLGPFLYEETEADDIGDIAGGISLPFTLPITLSSANIVTQPIHGRLLTRCYRWGVQPRKVTKAEVRGTLDADSTLSLALMARNPNYRLWRATRDFTAADFQTTDVPLRKLCGERALEAQVEIITTSGRPTFRSVSVETMQVGKVEE
jgi:hypothetical protein